MQKQAQLQSVTPDGGTWDTWLPPGQCAGQRRWTGGHCGPDPRGCNCQHPVSGYRSLPTPSRRPEQLGSV